MKVYVAIKYGSNPYTSEEYIIGVYTTQEKAWKARHCDYVEEYKLDEAEDED